MKKKLLTFILVLVMTLMFVPSIASAASAKEFAGGSGTKKDPYLISTKAQLNNVRKYLNKHYKLTCDITFTKADFAKGGAFYNKGAGWAPITTFNGTFDGNGFAVKNLYVKKSSSSGTEYAVYAGLFGVNNGTIQNLGMVASNISATSNSSYSWDGAYAGGIAGFNSGTIENCYNTGEVSATSSITAYAYASGIAGYNYYGTITNCYNTGKVSATSEDSSAYAGGISGGGATISNCYNTGNISATAGWSGAYAGGISGNGGIISNCYNTGNVSATTKSTAQAGGISGIGFTISNCYNTGNISATAEWSDAYAGGISGSGGIISNCYNTGKVSATAEEDFAYAGGISGINYDDIENCYYSTMYYGVGYGSSTGTIGCTAKQMQTKSTFVGFDFSKTWEINAKSPYKYPVLKSIHPYKKVTATLSTTSYTYNGKVKTPAVTVKNSVGKTLTKNTDYTVTYASGRINAGTYKVTIKGKGNYSFTKTLTFKIKPAKLGTCKLSTTSYTYNGSVRKPAVTVKNASGDKLTTSSYTATFASGRKNVGTYKVTIKGKGNYTGTKTLTFKIKPAATTVSKLTAGSKSITVGITKKTSQVTGYQIQYSTSKTFSSAITKNISSYKTTSYALKGLSARKTYFVRVRTYKTVNNTKYYSAWSTYKYVKTK